jgi:hypothetical protein
MQNKLLTVARDRALADIDVQRLTLQAEIQALQARLDLETAQNTSLNQPYLFLE